MLLDLHIDRLPENMVASLHGQKNGSNKINVCLYIVLLHCHINMMKFDALVFIGSSSILPPLTLLFGSNLCHKWS